jgi:hypothetical protein
MSVVVPIRMSEAEHVKLTEMVYKGYAGVEGPVEFFRLLLHREWNRRHNLPKPKAADWQTAFRNGRPKK